MKSWFEGPQGFGGSPWGMWRHGPEQAYELARQKLAVVRETGGHPSRQEARSEHLLELKGVTLADCFAA